MSKYPFGICLAFLQTLVLSVLYVSFRFVALLIYSLFAGSQSFSTLFLIASFVNSSASMGLPWLLSSVPAFISVWLTSVILRAPMESDYDAAVVANRITGVILMLGGLAAFIYSFIGAFPRIDAVIFFLGGALLFPAKP